jgi:hypothetical protein
VSRGQHAADDGSFGRSAGGAMARGIVLILVAVLLGVVLLNATDAREPHERAASSDDDDRGTTPTTEPADTTEPTDTTLPEARDPAEVTVFVVNGSGVRGAAARVTETLRASNYVTTEPGNAPEVAESSRVYFTPGYEADAAAVASLLTPPPAVEAMPDPAPVEDLRGAQIVVVIAADLAGGSG